MPSLKKKKKEKIPIMYQCGGLLFFFYEILNLYHFITFPDRATV